VADEAHSTEGDLASEGTHPSHDGSDVNYFDLTDDEQRTLRPAKLAKVAATRLSLRDLTAEVHRLSKQDTIHVTRQLKKNANAPAAAIAQALRVRLAKITEEEACRVLHDALHNGVLATARTAQLQECELAALLTADPADLNFLVEYELRDTLVVGAEEFGVSAPIRVATWSSMICSGHEGAVAALGWLVADPPEFWNDIQRQAVTKVWAQVRERLPRLPEQPTSLANLCDVITGLERTGALETMTSDTYAASDTASTGDGSIVDVTAEAGEFSPADVETLTARLTDFQVKYQNVRSGALSELNVAMTAGRMPPRDALLTIETLATDMERLIQGVADAAGSPTADTLEQALDDLETVATARATAVLLDHIGRLTSLRAPEYVATEAAQIADMAATADADTDPAELAALDALVAAIDLGDSDPQQFTELVRTVQTGLPSAAVLVMLASNRLLSISATAVASVTPAVQYERAGNETAGGPAGSDAGPAAPMPQPVAAAMSTDLRDPEGASDTRQTAAYADESEAAERGDVETGSDESAQPAPRADADTVPELEDLAVPRPPSAAPAPTETEDAAGTKAADVASTTGRSHDLAATVLAEEPSIDDVLVGLDLDIPTSAVEPADPAAAPVTISVRTEAGPDNDEAVDGQAVDVDTLYTSLTGARQYALAGWLAQTIGAPAASASAHRLAAHALAIRTSTGPNVAAFKDLVATLDADALRNLPGGQMLVYAASVRAGLLSPTAGAADPLRDMCPAVVKCGPAVRELTDALLSCVYSGAYLAPGSSNAVAEVASLESECAELVETARTMLDTAFARSIRYAAATELFKTWMTPTGYLGAPLTVVASGSRRTEDVNFVRARATELRSRGDLESAIDRDTPTSAHRRSRRIEARARDKVIDRATDVADILAAWVEATEALTQSSNTDWMSGPIADLRTSVASIRASAFAELTPLRGSEPPPRGAAVDAGLALLEGSLDLLTVGERLDSNAELPSDRVANGILALAADLPLNTAPILTPRRAVTVTDIAMVASALAADTAGWTTAFNRRAERADHVGTSVIVEMLRGHDPALARRLAAIRDRDAAAAADTLDERVAELAGRIDSDRRFGRLDADAWAQLSIRARAFEADSRGSRRDFDRMEHELAGIEEDRVKAVAEAIEAEWQQLADLQATASLTDDQAIRISECIAAEDVTTADEYIETIRSRGELPAPRDNFDQLTRFFPAFPAMFSATTSGLSPLAQLKRAMGVGQNPDSGELADVLTGAGIDIARVVRRATASSRLEAWHDLARSRTLDGRLPQVKPILEQLGFLVTKADTSSHHKGQVPSVSSWLHLTGVRGTEGGALIPAFGSKISPTGDTLRVLALWNSPTPGRLVELLRDEPADHSVLVLYFGTLGVDARRELATLVRSGRKLPTTIVADAAAFGYLVAQPTPRRDTTMAITLPFASSAPFTPDVAGLVPMEMFYGRTEELDQVLDMMGSCIVYGGRQLGKSALLRAAARKFNEGQHREAIYQSIYKVGQGTIPADKVWVTLWPRLAEKGIAPEDLPSGDIAAAAAERIADWVHAVPGRQLLLLLDESDFFLDADAKEGKFTHVAAFRELMEQTERAVKVVFAGLHQTARFERLANHPLAHFGDPVCVGPLTPQHAYDLLTTPLRALGCRFEDDNVAARVLALANNQPSLIQLFGAKLLTYLRRLGTPATLPQVVTAADVETVWSDKSLRESFRKRFDWTLNLDPRYKIIAYTVAYHAHTYSVGSALSPTDLRSQCEQWWPQGFAAEDVRTGEFRALLDECVALGVLSYAPAEGAYRLRTPNVLALLGSRDEVEDVLDTAESTPLPDSFDGSLLRPPYAGGITRSPLTSAQIADLLTARNQVRVIAGTEALTVERCARVLHDENANAVYGTRSIPIKEATATNLDSACNSASMIAGHSVVLVDLRPATHTAAAEAWDKSRDAIATRVGGTLGIVLITGPAQASLWVRATVEADASSSLTALHRYDNTGLRLWMNEATIPFQDDASRADLLTVSGGWPMLLNRVVATPIGERDAEGRTDALDDLRDWLAQPTNAKAFLDALGVRTDDVLRAAWNFLVTALSGDAADARTLADLMALSASEEQYAALTPERLNAAGYRDTEALVGVFRSLGVLVIDAANGQLRLEPVAVSAARASTTKANE
jgi:hypothetical protein